MRPRRPAHRPWYRAALSACTVVAAVGFAVAPAASAHGAPPPVSGCPAGWQTLSVAALLGQGYGVPAIVDDPASGGNGDGVICGNPINATRAAQICGGPCGVPVLYNFRDNNLTPWH
jgi:hypothetical protein